MDRRTDRQMDRNQLVARWTDRQIYYASGPLIAAVFSLLELTTQLQRVRGLQTCVHPSRPPRTPHCVCVCVCFCECVFLTSSGSMSLNSMPRPVQAMKWPLAGSSSRVTRNCQSCREPRRWYGGPSRYTNGSCFTLPTGRREREREREREPDGEGEKEVSVSTVPYHSHTVVRHSWQHATVKWPGCSFCTAVPLPFSQRSLLFFQCAILLTWASFHFYTAYYQTERSGQKCQCIFILFFNVTVIFGLNLTFQSLRYNAGIIKVKVRFSVEGEACSRKRSERKEIKFNKSITR